MGFSDRTKFMYQHTARLFRHRRHWTVFAGTVIAGLLSWGLVPTATTLQAITPSKSNPALATVPSQKPTETTLNTFTWSYSGATGPENWSVLEPEYGKCGDTRQSPIDIPPRLNAESLPITLSSTPLRYKFADSGRAWTLTPMEEQSVVVEGTTYHLKSIEFHSPSEHTIAGFNYPLEIQLIHVSSSGRKIGIAVFVDRGKNTSLAFDTVLRWSQDPTAAADPAPMSPKSFLPGKFRGWSYSGSLTSPPCSEGVRWFVLADTLEYSGEQIAGFRKNYPNNVRPTQPRNNRSFDLFPGAVGNQSVSH